MKIFFLLNFILAYYLGNDDYYAKQAANKEKINDLL